MNATEFGMRNRDEPDKDDKERLLTRDDRHKWYDETTIPSVADREGPND